MSPNEKAQVLREAAEDIRIHGGAAWGGDRSWFTTGQKVADLVAEWLMESALDAEAEAAR